MPIGELTHDWTVNIGEWSFGMREYYWHEIPGLVSEHQLTVIEVGPIDYSVDYSASAVLSMCIAVTVIAIFIVSWFFAKLSRDRGGPI